MKAKWTPGPWQVGGRYWGNTTVCCEGGREFVADCGSNIMSMNNAHLIVAAPEMADLIYRLDRAVGNGNGRVALDMIANEAGLLLTKINGG